MTIEYMEKNISPARHGWAIYPIGSLLETGSTITYGVVQPGRNAPDGVLFIRGGDIFEGRLDEKNLRRITRKLSEQHERTRLRGGELLISLVGYPGECTIVPKHLAGANIARQVALVRLANNSPASTDYVCHYLQSTHGRRSLLKEAFGSAQQVINLRDVNRIELLLPESPAEQRAIAAALSDVDALLAGLERLIAKKRDLKQAAMQQLLTGQTRLPGFGGAWAVKRLGDLGTFVKGRGVKKDEAKTGDLPCIRYGEIYTHHNDCIRSFNSWISREVAATATPIKKGDLLFAGSGETKAEIGKCVAFIGDGEAYAGSDIVILRLREADATFMGYCCNTSPINTQKSNNGQGDAVVHISAAALSSVEISLPSQQEQTAIAAVLSDMDAELSALETRRDKTQALKQGMMQELLTGRTRLV